MRFFFSAVALVTTSSLFHLLHAQAPMAEGRIEYEVRINMHKNIPKEREEMKAMVPEFNVFRTETYFNPTESYSRPIEEDEDPDAAPQGGRTMRFRMGGYLSTTYTNIETQERISSQDFAGKPYLILDTIKVIPWKFQEEEKTILGYPCKLATYMDTTMKTTIQAWYTMQLRPHLGPDMIGSLPGAVLQVELVERASTITAVFLDPKKPKKSDIKRPTSGTKVTRSEFNAIVKEQMEKMRQNGFNIQRN
jgi:GLPGLI family protein